MTERESPGGSSDPILLVNEAGPVRLDQFLCDRLPGKTRAFVQRLIRDGFAVAEDGRRLKPSSKIGTGERVTVRVPPPPPSELTPRYAPFEIIYEDADLAAIVKPPGLTVHPAPGMSETTLVHGLLWRMSTLSGMGGWDRPGIVHRLDRDTSGVMIVAKNDVAHHKLTLMFKAREIHKTYVAVCTAREAFGEGVVEAPICRSARDRKAMSIRYDSGRAAITEYRVRHMFGRYAVVEAHPRSGRTHQIRVHLKFLGMPLLCDAVYGSEKVVYRSTLCGRAREPNEPPLLSRQALHAQGLRFAHPRTGVSLRIESALPPDMLGLIGFLRSAFEERR